MDTPSSIEAGKAAIERLKRNKQSLHEETIKITMEEHQLVMAEKMAKEYAESVERLKQSIARRKKTLDFAAKYVAEHEDDNTRAAEAEKLAKKIEALKKQLASMEKEQQRLETK